MRTRTILNSSNEKHKSGDGKKNESDLRKTSSSTRKEADAARKSENQGSKQHEEKKSGHEIVDKKLKICANGTRKSSQKEKHNREMKSPRKRHQNEDDDGNEAAIVKIGKKQKASYKFSLSRVNHIIRSELKDLRTNRETVFLISQATEKFVELFCEDTHVCALRESKRHISYKHLSSVVSGKERYDFLSDFVPVKKKARHALADRKNAVDVLSE